MDAALHFFGRLATASDAEVDLAAAALAVAQVEHPALVPDEHLRRLDGLAAASAADTGPPRRRLERLVSFLFDEQGFRGNADHYYDPRNSCLNDVLDRRLGIPITLSVLTIEVGRRVGLSISGVGLPGHFIVAADIGGEPRYLDPFHGGATLSEDTAADVASRAVGRPVRLEPGHWTPCSKRQIVVRMLRNLKTIYAREQCWERALAVVDRLLAVDADAPTHVRDRGTVLVRLGRLHEGAAEWERYLSRHPAAQDAETFRQELRKVRQELGSRN